MDVRRTRISWFNAILTMVLKNYPFLDSRPICELANIAVLCRIYRVSLFPQKNTAVLPMSCKNPSSQAFFSHSPRGFESMYLANSTSTKYIESIIPR